MIVKLLALVGMSMGAVIEPSVINNIFGTQSIGARIGEQGGYSGQQIQGDANTDLLVQIVTGTGAGADQLPGDYVSQTSKQIEQETVKVEVDSSETLCSEYSKTLGYECVPYYQCSNGTIITDGGGLIDIRNGFGALNAEDSKCPGFLDVCCKDPDFVPPPTPTPQVYRPKCGQRNFNGLGARITGFKEGESQPFEWPHMCAVLKEELVGGQDVKLFQCGASLISPDTMLTAAHCVQKLRNEVGSITVRCGEWDTQTTSEPYPHQDRKVRDLRIHPEFNPRNLANDLAVLFLDSPFELDHHIDTVCLPEPGESFDYNTCFATGWGKDKFGAEGNYQVVLKEVELPVVGRDQCERDLRVTRLGGRFRLDQSFLCAGGKGKDTCKGDGGSPLVCPSKITPNTWVQAGVVAWGVGCGGDSPGVYADVSHGVCWVDQAMTCYYGGQSGDFSSYWGHEVLGGCSNWARDTTERLQKDKNQARDSRRRAEAADQLRQYQECTVRYEGHEDYDFSAFQRVGVKSTTESTTTRRNSGGINFGK